MGASGKLAIERVSEPEKLISMMNCPGKGHTHFLDWKVNAAGAHTRNSNQPSPIRVTTRLCSHGTIAIRYILHPCLFC